MYRSFYGLREKPFHQTPDPRFLYLTPAHREALAGLQYGVEQRMGFMVLTGEIGTGKTTILQALMQRLGPEHRAAFLFTSNLLYDEILEYVLKEFGIEPPSSRAMRLHALNADLKRHHATGGTTLLVIDEAQLLEPETLEQVRLLSNFETSVEKLMHIVLVGQPELRDKLNLPELRQLKQRIGLRCRIHPLSPDAVPEYIEHRLRVAGAEDPMLFAPSALDLIVEYSRGTPRVVNMLCDHCLVIGFADDREIIEKDTVEQAIEYLEDGAEPSALAAKEPVARGSGSARRKLSNLGWG